MSVLTEIWKPVVEWEGLYEVSNKGRVRSLNRWIPRGNSGYYVQSRLMKLTLSDRGYYRVELREGYRKRKVQFVHVLVGKAFIDTNHKGVFDHKNRNRQDNKVCNLRLATHSQDGANRIKHRGTSKYKGVSLVQRLISNPWSAQIHFKGTKKHLGYYPTQEQAALAYNTSAIKYFKEFARLNEI